MRRQDEIRLLFPSQDADTQKFLLAELDAYALAFDSEEVFDLLRASLTGGSPPVQLQALVTSSFFMPRFVTRRMRVANEEAGLWSRYQDNIRADAKLTGVLNDQQARLRERAREVLAPAARTLATRFARLPPAARPMAQLALCYVGSDFVLTKLSEAVQAAPQDASALWAWAFAGGGAQDPDRLVTHLDRRGVRTPELLLVASSLPLDHLLALAKKLDGRLDGSGTANLATALSRYQGSAALTALARLCRSTTGWGQIHVLRALGATGHPQALDVVKHIHTHSHHPFVKQQAIRAAGGLFSERAIAFCLEQAAAEDPASVAQALETLVRLRCPRSELAQVARPHVNSGHLRTRVNALLALVNPRSHTLPRNFLELLENSEPLPRVEAAFCLGYWPHPSCVEALAAMAASDPAPAARQQAIKSLSKQPGEDSLAALMRIAMSGGPGEALTAVRVLARGATLSRSALESLLKALPAVTDAARRGLLIRGAASLTAPEGDPRLVEVLAADTASDEADRLVAALDAWKLVGGPQDKQERQRVLRLGGHADPGVFAAATVAGFLAGELSLLSKLESRLNTDEGPALVASCEALLELALLASEVVGKGHALLGSALDRAPRELDPSLSTARYPCRGSAQQEGSPLQAEGEFHLDSESSAVGVRKEESPRDQVLGELAAHYRKKAGKKGDVATALQRDTYIVAGPAAEKNLSAESAAERLRRTLRQAGAVVRAHPALLIPPVVFLVVCALVARRLAAPEQVYTVSAPVALSLVQASGKVRVAGDPAPLASGDVVRFGEVLQLAPGAVARLITPGGDSVRASGPGELEIGKQGSPQELELTLTDGRVEYVAAPGAILRLHCASHSVSCESGAVEAAFAGGKLTVLARAPVVSVTHGNAREELKVGQPRLYDR